MWGSLGVLCEVLGLIWGSLVVPGGVLGLAFGLLGVPGELLDRILGAPGGYQGSKSKPGGQHLVYIWQQSWRVLNHAPAAAVAQLASFWLLPGC